MVACISRARLTSLASTPSPATSPGRTCTRCSPTAWISSSRSRPRRPRWRFSGSAESATRCSSSTTNAGMMICPGRKRAFITSIMRPSMMALVSMRRGATDAALRERMPTSRKMSACLRAAMRVKTYATRRTTGSRRYGPTTGRLATATPASAAATRPTTRPSAPTMSSPADRLSAARSMARIREGSHRAMTAPSTQPTMAPSAMAPTYARYCQGSPSSRPKLMVRPIW